MSGRPIRPASPPPPTPSAPHIVAVPTATRTGRAGGPRVTIDAQADFLRDRDAALALHEADVAAWVERIGAAPAPPSRHGNPAAPLAAADTFAADRGSHFCTTTHAGQGPDAVQQVHIGRVLKALGIQHILARGPQARGRSERVFRTIQGRLPQEVRMHGITDYAAANVYLQERFVPEFNDYFGVEPSEPDSAFTSVRGIELDLLLSIRHERIVRGDNTVSYRRVVSGCRALATSA